MAIEIYATWEDMTALEEAAQVAGSPGSVGFLQETLHDGPYATEALLPEAFNDCGGARIPAASLARRLPAALALEEKRQREIYGAVDERVMQNYRDFVALCARKEAETGRPCRIVAT
jgi:hypothetical protein